MQHSALLRKPPVKNAMHTLAHPDDQEIFLTAISNVLAAPGPFFIRYRLIRVERDGQFWFQPRDADGAAFAMCLIKDAAVHESPQIQCELGSVSSVCTHPETYRGGTPR